MVPCSALQVINRNSVAMQETEKVRWEEQRKSMQQDAQTKAQLAQYEDELARKRNDAEHHKNRERNQELVALQEQSNRNQQSEKRRIQEQIEGERRATEKYKVSTSLLLPSSISMFARKHILSACHLHWAG